MHLSSAPFHSHPSPAKHRIARWHTLLGLFLFGTLAVSCHHNPDLPITCHATSDCPEHSFCRSELCIVDRDAPKLTIDTPTENELVKSETLRVTGRAEETGSGIGQITYRIDEAAATVLPSQDSNFGFDLHNREEDYHRVVLRMEARDVLGNLSGEVMRTFFVDRKAPTLTLEAPSEVGVDATDYTVTGRAEDASGEISKTELSFDGGATWTPVASGSFSVTHQVSSADRGTTQRVQLRSIDGAGNVGSKEIEVRIPSIQITNPKAGSVLTGATMLVEAHAGGGRLESMSFAFEGQVTKVVDVVSGTATFTLPTIDHSSHRVIVTGAYADGHTSSAEVEFYIDNLKPRLTLDLLEGQAFTGATKLPVVVDGTVIENRLKSLTASFDGGKATDLEVLGGEFSLQLPIQPEDYTPHKVTIVATDEQGNVETLIRNYVVDTKGPSLTFTSPTADGKCTESSCTGAIINLATEQFDFWGSLSDASGAASTELTATFVGKTQSKKGSTAWSFRWNEFPNDPGHLYPFVITATDRFGNSTSVTRYVYIDRVKPTVRNTTEFCSRDIIQDGRVRHGADLLRFSEPMNQPSVVGSFRFKVNGTDDGGIRLAPVRHDASNPVCDDKQGALAGTTYPDYRSYGAAGDGLPYFDGIDLEPTSFYYNATDLVGNSLEPYKWSFVSEARNPPNGLVTQNGYGILQTDTHGKPYILAGSGKSISLLSWNGTEWLTSQPVLPNAGGATYTIQDFRWVDNSLEALVGMFSAANFANIQDNTIPSEPIHYMTFREPEGWTVNKSHISEFNPKSSLSPIIFGFDSNSGNIAFRSPKKFVTSGLSVYESALTSSGLIDTRISSLPSNTYVRFPFHVSTSGAEDTSTGTPLGSPTFSKRTRIALISPVRSPWTKPITLYPTYIAWTGCSDTTNCLSDRIALKCSVAGSPTIWKGSSDMGPRVSPVRYNDIRFGESGESISVVTSTEDNKIYLGTIRKNDCISGPSQISWTMVASNGSAPSIAYGHDVWLVTYWSTTDHSLRIFSIKQ